MKETLKNKLAELHQVLSKGEPLDDESIELLKQLDTDIEKLLEGKSEEDGLSERIEKQAVAFEGQHPQLSAVLRDIMETLAKIGI